MSNPTVCCVMLTKDRPEMLKRAVASFHAQTYENKALFVLDTGEVPAPLWQTGGVYGEHYPGLRIDKKSIGALRNFANEFARDNCLNAQIIAHMDDDDVSHPNRLSEQVALLQASGADAVGYNSALFWWSDPNHIPDAECVCDVQDDCPLHDNSQAWLYTSPKSDVALGGTLAYWRRTWEQKRFQNLKHGEDTAWETGMRVAAVSGVPGLAVNMMNIDVANEPRFIAHIHGANTSSVITPTVRDWRRVPECDEICRERMKL